MIFLGNCTISDTGISYLNVLPLRRLNLSSFHAITDTSIKSLLNKTPLKSLNLSDLPQITENVVTRAINLCHENQKRKIDLTISSSQLNKKMLENLVLPKNLKLKFDNQCNNKLSEEEPTPLQMMIVIAMSALILIMALLTTVVVVLVPLAMALMMIHEYLFQSFVLEMPNLFQFKGSFSFNVALLRQAYFKLLYSLI
jgi:hypothetical protein